MRWYSAVIRTVKCTKTLRSKLSHLLRNLNDPQRAEVLKLAACSDAELPCCGLQTFAFFSVINEGQSRHSFFIHGTSKTGLCCWSSYSRILSICCYQNFKQQFYPLLKNYRVLPGQVVAGSALRTPRWQRCIRRQLFHTKSTDRRCSDSRSRRCFGFLCR